MWNIQVPPLCCVYQTPLIPHLTTSLLPLSGQHCCDNCLQADLSQQPLSGAELSTSCFLPARHCCCEACLQKPAQSFASIGEPLRMRKLPHRAASDHGGMGRSGQILSFPVAHCSNQINSRPSEDSCSTRLRSLRAPSNIHCVKAPLWLCPFFSRTQAGHSACLKYKDGAFSLPSSVRTLLRCVEAAF